jgi:hypothetical protein
MTRRELQIALGQLREQGFCIEIKLTASTEALQAEFDRLTAIEQPHPATNQPSSQPESLQHKDLNPQLTTEATTQPNTPENSQKPYRIATFQPRLYSYLSDITTDTTQQQALENLEDGIRWLVRLPGNIKAFYQGFYEGWQDAKGRRSHKPRDVAKVIQLPQHRLRSLKVA